MKRKHQSSKKQLLDMNKLMAQSAKQLDEHKTWLRKMIDALSADTPGRDVVIGQIDELKLRIVRADKTSGVTIVYDYPDELYALLTSDSCPQELKDSLRGSTLVSIDEPAFSLKRIEDTPGAKKA